MTENSAKLVNHARDKLMQQQIRISKVDKDKESDNPSRRKVQSEMDIKGKWARYLKLTRNQEGID